LKRQQILKYAAWVRPPDLLEVIAVISSECGTAQPQARQQENGRHQAEQGRQQPCVNLNFSRANFNGLNAAILEPMPDINPQVLAHKLKDTDAANCQHGDTDDYGNPFSQHI
jgi:hypothetical protein